jgi:hypothetical protein
MSTRILRLNEYAGNWGANPDETEMNFDESLIDSLVELVGSEEEVEAAAKAAHDDLMTAFEKNEVEVNDEDVPEKLAIAALILKLVEMGKIGPEEADDVMAEHLG